MKELKTPNSWSCLPTAFAIALEVPLEAVLAIVGHDGSEERFKSLPDPQRRRGFHQQEMVKMCLEDGIAATPIELLPSVAPYGDPVAYGDPRGECDWFFQNLRDSEGVLECRTSMGVGHAVAYSGLAHTSEVCDPRDGKKFYMETLEDLQKRGLFVFNMWRLDNIT